MKKPIRMSRRSRLLAKCERIETMDGLRAALAFARANGLRKRAATLVTRLPPLILRIMVGHPMSRQGEQRFLLQEGDIVEINHKYTWSRGWGSLYTADIEVRRQGHIAVKGYAPMGHPHPTLEAVRDGGIVRYLRAGTFNVRDADIDAYIIGEGYALARGLKFAGFTVRDGWAVFENPAHWGRPVEYRTLEQLKESLSARAA